MTPTAGLRDVNLHLIECWDDAQRFISWLGERRPVLAFDTETGGLTWTQDIFRLAQFGDAMRGWAIPPEWLGLAREAFIRYDGPLVAHNLKFDMHFLANVGIELPRHQLHDTSLMAHILDPRRPRALKKLASKYVDPHADLGQQALQEGMALHRWGWADVPIKFGAYWMYSALDPVITSRLFELWQPEVATYQEVYDLEMAVSLVVFDMERRGFRADLEYTERASVKLREYADQTRAWVLGEYGVKPTNNRVSEILVREGVRLTERTPGGALKMDEGVLSGVDHPLATAVLGIRQAEKFAKTYFEAIQSYAVDGIVHSDIKTLGARTGRMSVARPPLQQLPSGSALVRDCFVPSPGNVLISTDYDQVELRLLAHFAQESSMIESIRDGVDLHTFAAQRIFRTPTPTKSQRKQAKGGSFAKVYGAGAAKFAEQQGISEAEAQQFLTMYDQTFPGVPRFISEVERAAKMRLASEGVGYVKSPVGRWHPLKHGEGEYVLVNYLIQGSAADLFKQAIVALDSAGFGDYLAMFVHDEVIADVPADIAPDVAREIADVMSDLTSYAVPISASGEIVHRWGDAYAKCREGLPCDREFCDHERQAA